MRPQAPTPRATRTARGELSPDRVLGSARVSRARRIRGNLNIFRLALEAIRPPPAVPATPLLSPASPPNRGESRYFSERRDVEGENSFARELWISIRNDHFLRGCTCGNPSIWKSKEEAEAASGHLRFYLVGTEKKDLRVLQNKEDTKWHCVCARGGFDSHRNANGKRPAGKLGKLFGRREARHDTKRARLDPVSPTRRALGRQEQKEQEHFEASEDLATLPSTTTTTDQSIWTKARGIINRAVTTMSGSVTNFLGAPSIEKDGGDVVKHIGNKAGGDGDVLVQKVKSRVATATANANDGFDDLEWAAAPTALIGRETIEGLRNDFSAQHDAILERKFVRGYSAAEIRLRGRGVSNAIVDASIGIMKYQSRLGEPIRPGELPSDQTEKWERAADQYRERLASFVEFVDLVYDQGRFDALKKVYRRPPRSLTLHKAQFRLECRGRAKFMAYLLSLEGDYEMSPRSRLAIGQMLVDANAVRKSELLPSYVVVSPNPTVAMPGHFPQQPQSAVELVAADKYEIVPLHEYKFPVAASSAPAADQTKVGRHGAFKRVFPPKSILKSSNEDEGVDQASDLAPAPTSKPLATPPTKRTKRLSFVSPLATFVPPSHLPVRVMTSSEREKYETLELEARVIGDAHSTRAFAEFKTHHALGNPQKSQSDQAETDEQEMGLLYYSRKYKDFLSGLKGDLNEKTLFAPRWVPPAKKEYDPRALDKFFAEDKDDLAALCAATLNISETKYDQLQVDAQLQVDIQAANDRRIEEERKRKEFEKFLFEQARLDLERQREEEERRREEEEEEERRREAAAQEVDPRTGLRKPARSLIDILSEEQDEDVNKIAAANPSAELAKTLEGQSLTRRDFVEKLLPPTAWLNDNIIIGSILYLADYVNKAKGATDQEPKCAAFTSYFWPRVESHGIGACGRLLRKAGVRKANFLDIDTILIPICSGAHWTLAVIRPGQRTVAHMDSMRSGAGHPTLKAKLLEVVRFILEDKFVEAEWSAFDYAAPRQTNGWDCGVFTITNAMCLALGLNPKLAYTENDMTLQRRRLAAMLTNGGFTGDFSLDGF
ncbi:uncharacterized protein C8A04DRAFT_28186 [Dichotomopilus funicola]|uniref:Ubiquitin-like protease family profile domain-containing protein n=1 Tax=Dichotomopilus funicola TaxID=1934379 RepID=A0AAN6ZNE0_9PEZI|nr:hypothetical protein C8A04DRAFT_28186 [Dichotomopilus funicola]